MEFSATLHKKNIKIYKRELADQPKTSNKRKIKDKGKDRFSKEEPLLKCIKVFHKPTRINASLAQL